KWQRRGVLSALNKPKDAFDIAWKMIKRFAPYLLIAGMAVAAHFTGLLQPLNWHLSDFRMELLEREASGQLLIVQIDAKSLRELDVWPWPRAYHATVIDRLVAAGASEIALDIDLSSRGVLGPDDPLVNSVKRASEKVILPVFQQGAQGRRDQSNLMKTQPLPDLARSVQLGGANVFAAEDGLVRQVEAVTSIEDQRFPAIFTLLAGPAYLDHGTFHIDFGIRAASIPRLSYVDVYKGRFDPAAVRNKKIIVGAVAAELGDNFAVPAQRIISGTELQALAFESLIQNRAVGRISPWVLIGIAAIICLAFAFPRLRNSWGLSVTAGMVIIIIVEVAALAVSDKLPLILPNAIWIATAAMAALFNVGLTLKVRGEQILNHKLDQRRRRRLMHAVMEQAFEGIVVAQTNGVIRDANAAASKLLRIPKEQMIGLRVQDFLPAITQAMQQGETSAPPVAGDDGSGHLAPVEQQVSCFDGDTIDVEMALTRVSLNQDLNNMELLVIAMRDIGQRKAAERARDEAHRKALEADRTKTEFLANMSHELRTPLNAIIGFSEVIESGAFGAVDPPQYRAYASDIHTSGMHLLTIINRILDISRVELGEVEVQWDEVNPEALVSECIDIAKGWHLSKTKDLSYSVQPGVERLIADPGLMRQILINLISNAVKFTKADGRIAVMVQGTSKCLEIRVTDNGIGIPSEALGKITNPFVQVEGAFSREHGGVGLGLSLVDQYVKLLGGTLGFESELGGGTTAIVRLPNSSQSFGQTKVAAA
ncbi:MAG TPA: CHASE2 domain-containing protein, partial [Nitrospiraceae bacterium]